MVLVEKGDQIRTRDRKIGTIIIPEPKSNSGAIIEDHPQGVLRPRGELITSHSWHHMGGKKQMSWQPRDL